MPVSEYFNRVNADLLAVIPPDARVILEIGCGAGALCEAYRRINPGVKWHGFDINREAIATAKQTRRCTSAQEIDIEREDVFDFGIYENNLDPGEADCLIAGDVLEHCFDPWTLLKRLVQGIAPGAQILACIPNVQHWTVIRDLIAGHWRYADEGLLDRTHLRFFTLESIREMFEQAGLQVFEIRGRDLCNEGSEHWHQEYDIPTRKELRAYQYVVRAVKPIVCVGHSFKDGFFNNELPIKPLHIHAVTAEECCARPRIREPLAMIGTIPGVRCTTSQFRDGYPNSDILIQQRYRIIDWGIQNDHVQEAVIVIAELDDDPAALEGMSDDNYAPLRAVHAVQVSTEPLAEIVREFNPNVFVFPNQIADLPPPKEFKEGKNVRIFYGAQNRENDWKPIMSALNRVLEFHQEVIVEVVHDRAFYEALDVAAVGKLIKKAKARFHPFLPYHEYRALLRSCDIALLPLEPGRFNECKSDLKFLECAAEGVAVLASLYYGSPLDLNPMGEFYGEPQSFELALGSLIEHRKFRRKYAERAYAYVRDHRLLSQHYRKLHAWYLDLISRRAPLHQQLLDRCPELHHDCSPQHEQVEGTSPPALEEIAP